MLLGQHLQELFGTKDAEVKKALEIQQQVGDRIGQVYLREVLNVEFEEVVDLSDTSRGNGGYGSTGIK